MGEGGGANLGSTRCQVPLEFATTSGILGPLLQGGGGNEQFCFTRLVFWKETD